MKLSFAFLKRLTALCAVGLSLVASAEEAYLESNGTQCVPIGYWTKPTTKYVLDFQMTAAEVGKVVFGGWYGTGTRVGLWVNGNGNFEINYGGNYWSGGMRAGDTTRHTLTLDIPNHQAKLATGSSVATKTLNSAGDSSEPGSVPVSLFALLTSTTVTNSVRLSKTRFYDLKIYESGVLVHHYIPCIRDGLAGAYDTESGAFFTDSQTPLAYGGNILQYDDDEDEAHVSSPNGNVCIETGYKATPDTCLDMDFTLLDVPAGAEAYLYETAYAYNGYLCGRLYCNSSGVCGFNYANGTNGKSEFRNIGYGNAQRPFLAGVRHRAIIDSYHSTVTYYSCGLTNDHYSFSMTRTNAVCPRTMKLLSSNYDSPSKFAKAKIYRFKIYEKGVLKHDYIPMKSFGVGVLKDQVTGRTLSSKTSTALSFGGKIKEEPYLESLGTTQCIALDYYPNNKTYLEMDYQVLTRTKNGQMLAANLSTFSYRMNGNTNQEFRCNGVYSGGAAGKPDYKRHTAIMNVPAKTVSYLTAGVCTTAIDLTTKSGYGDQPTCTYKLGVFGDGGGSGTGARMRLFFLSIWEDGVLVHKYEPYVKDGVPGLKDSVTDAFASGKTNDGLVSDIICGGEMPYEGEAGDAYVESDGTQAVLTDYTPTADSRIEIDFKMLVCSANKCLCGSFKSPYWDINIDSSAKFYALAHSGWTADTVTKMISCNRNRHVAILDGKNREIKITSDNVTNSYTAAAAGTATTIPFALFGRNKGDGTFGGNSLARIYSVRIYENDTNLVREFLPYQNGTVIGFRDSVTGVIVTNAIAGANALKLGGIGVEGSGSAFKVAPLDTRVDVDETGTLSAYAPGAVKYVWTKDGETVAGASGATLSVPWDKKIPHQHVYTVTPVYNVFGNEVKGTPVSATAENAKRGHVILLK